MSAIDELREVVPLIEGLSPTDMPMVRAILELDERLRRMEPIVPAWNNSDAEVCNSFTLVEARPTVVKSDWSATTNMIEVEAASVHEIRLFKCPPSCPVCYPSP